MEDLRMVLRFRAKAIEGRQKSWGCPSQDRETAIETGIRIRTEEHLPYKGICLYGDMFAPKQTHPYTVVDDYLDRNKPWRDAVGVRRKLTTTRVVWQKQQKRCRRTQRYIMLPAVGGNIHPAAH